MKKIFFTILLLSCCGYVFATSAFGKIGFLNQNLSRDFYSAGMGYTGSADLFRFNAGLINPSMAVTTDKVQFSTGFSSGWIYPENGDNQRDLSKAVEYDLPFCNIIFPFGDNFVALDFASGYSGEYEYKYSNITEETFNNFYKFGLVYARKTPWFNLGVGANYYVGSAQNDVTKTDAGHFVFTDTSRTVKLDSTYKTSEDFDVNAFSYSIGISKQFKDFSLGFYYIPSVELSGDNEFSKTSSIYTEVKYKRGGTATTGSPYSTYDSTYTLKDSTVVTGKEKKEIKLPQIFGTGFTYKFNDVWKLSADADYQVWENSSYFADVDLHNTFNFGIGVAYDMNIDPWYWNIPLRAGYYRKEFPFKAGGSYLTENGFTFGFDIPVNEAKNSRATIALQYFTRGSKSKNGYNEQEFKLSIGFIGFDIFSSRRKLLEDRDIPVASEKYDLY